MSDEVRTEKLDSVLIITMNRPERHNAVNMEMWVAGERILADFAARAR